MIVELTDLRYSWKNGSAVVIDIPSLALEAGERVFLWGPSGSGKSTLLALLGGVVPPQAGSLRVLDQDLARMGGPQRDRFRADHIGVIFQLFNLVPYLSVVENVTLPCRFSRRRRERALRRSPVYRLLPRSMQRMLRRRLGKPIARPVWDSSVRQWASQHLVEDSRAFLAFCGKPADYWTFE